MAARTGRLGVAHVMSRARIQQGVRPLGGACPPVHVDHACQVALPVDQEYRAQAVTQPVKSLDGGQSRIERGSPFDVPVRWVSGIGIGAQQEAPVDTLRFS